MLDTKLYKLNSMPYGLEDITISITDDYILYTCGFSSGKQGTMIKTNDTKFIKNKSNKLVRGFTNKTYKYNFDDNLWSPLPNYPGKNRQRMKSISVNNVWYCWGGYNYLPMKNPPKNNKNLPKKKDLQAFNDGYKLEFIENKWIWSSLPNLPKKMFSFSLVYCKNNNRIYLFGGAEVFEKTGSPDVDIIGKQLYYLELDNIINGWIYLAELSGTPRFSHASYILDNEIYIIGGIYSNKNWIYQNDGNKRFFNIIDNWKYNIVDNKWYELDKNNFHISNVGGASDNIGYENRYLFLFGNHIYKYSIYNNSLPINAQVDTLRDYYLIYDIIENKFILKKLGILFPINCPSYTINKNKIHLLGGETCQSFMIQDEIFGYNLDMNIYLELQ